MRNVVNDLTDGCETTPIAGVVIDDYTYENLLAGIIRKETGLHKSISEELRMKFDKMKEGYLGDS